MYTIPKPFRILMPKDNEGLAQIIRSSIEVLNLPLEGTAHIFWGLIFCCELPKTHTQTLAVLVVSSRIEPVSNV